MKFVKEEPIHQGRKIRYSFAVGFEEARVLRNLLEKAYRFMPDYDRNFLQEARRIEQMRRVIDKAIPELEEYNKKLVEMSDDKSVREMVNEVSKHLLK